MMEHRFYPGAVVKMSTIGLLRHRRTPASTTLALGELLMGQDLSGDLDKLNWVY